MLMLRRISVVLTGLLVTGFLATGAAAAAPVDGRHQDRLTAKERQGLRIAGDVLDVLFGEGLPRRDRY
ncbi:MULTISPECIES: hypothetical protein [Streptomyces]|uniref:Uncharacterized protein n=1 Tax=Streptomyces nigrescens TaxID=1920 RepID=A0ABY7IZJ1_STRNI|nr:MULTISPECIES: hypothetical protein [Streptomyces]MCR8578617.1 hypothetical protein [Streptomyces sp. Isolate_219]WAU02831.1 hypothetical protein STRNI_000899 [Streptomyces nigrescens]WDT59186.1 hypothetical protein NUT86_37040 [Streptomyces sp. G7(2002)]